MAPTEIAALVALAVSLVGSLFLGIVFLAVLYLFIRSRKRAPSREPRSSGPSMQDWERDLVVDACQRHRRQNAEASILREMVSAAGYDPEE